MDELERLCKDPIMIQVSHQEDRVHVAEPVRAAGYAHTHDSAITDSGYHTQGLQQTRMVSALIVMCAALAVPQ